MSDRKLARIVGIRKSEVRGSVYNPYSHLLREYNDLRYTQVICHYHLYVMSSRLLISSAVAQSNMNRHLTSGPLPLWLYVDQES